VDTEFTYKLALNSANALFHVKGALKISRFAGPQKEICRQLHFMGKVRQQNRMALPLGFL